MSGAGVQKRVGTLHVLDRSRSDTGFRTPCGLPPRLADERARSVSECGSARPSRKAPTTLRSASRGSDPEADRAEYGPPRVPCCHAHELSGSPPDDGDRREDPGRLLRALAYAYTPRSARPRPRSRCSRSIAWCCRESSSCWIIAHTMTSVTSSVITREGQQGRKHLGWSTVEGDRFVRSRPPVQRGRGRCDRADGKDACQAPR